MLDALSVVGGRWMGLKRQFSNLFPFSDNSSGPASKNGKRQRPAKKKAEGYEGAGDARNQRKTSLKLGTTRKGRAASLSNRRGSLRKRDRTAEKEAKAEAAEERRTVYLPE